MTSQSNEQRTTTLIHNIDNASQWLAQLSSDAVVPMAVGFHEHGFWPSRCPENGNWEQAVADVCSRRARTVEFYKLNKPGIGGGRLLVYWPEMSLADGAAEVETQGFFDCDNAPIADAWVGWLPTSKHYEGGALLSWIPKRWLKRVNAGIAVNPEECISWACPEVLPDYAASLASVGLALPSRDELRAQGLCPPEG